MKVKIALLSLVLGLALHTATGQSIRRMLINADYSFYSERFQEAIDLYQAVLDRRPENDKAAYHKMIAEYLTTKRGENVKPLIDFYKTGGTTDRFFHYWMGRIYYARYEFELSRKHFEKFLGADSFKSKEIIAESREYIKKAETAAQYYAGSSGYFVRRMRAPINSEYDDLSPASFGSQGEMVFASSRPIPDFIKSENEFAVLKTSKSGLSWCDPQALIKLGTLPPNFTSIEIVKDGARMYVYKKTGRGNFYYSEPSAGGWGTPKQSSLAGRGKTLESDFFINEEEDYVLFAGMKSYHLDIYESKKGANGQWSAPKAIKGINSKWDEDSPYVTPDGNYLYFSSNRSTSIGGFDIYKCTWDPKKKRWSKPENLGYPINTIDDEVNFQPNKDNTSGFFSSNRLFAMGGFDVYYYSNENNVVVQGKITDFDDMPMSDVVLTFKSMESTDQKYTARTDTAGIYQIEIPEDKKFIIDVTIGRHLVSESNFRSFLHDSLALLEHNLIVEGPEHDSTELAQAPVEVNPDKLFTANISNIYFDKESAEVPGDAEFIIGMMQRLLEHHPDMKLIVHGHADSLEPNKEELAVLRAENVKKKLVAKNIDPERIEVTGYADKELLASGDDEIDGRELNRRIEVSIVE